jgi:hypothetical protein
VVVVELVEDQVVEASAQAWVLLKASVALAWVAKNGGRLGSVA